MLPIFNDVIRRRQRNRENRNLRIERRFIRERVDVFSLPNARFIELFRLNKIAARELCDALLNDHLHTSSYRNAVPKEIKIFTALRFFATGCYQRAVGADFNLGLSQTAVHRCIHEVTTAINDNLTAIKVRFPTERIESNENKENFMEKFGFPGVLGVIDCTHIAILKPQMEEHNFVNRKGYHSLNVQIICDHKLKILNINANYPGSNHDSFIWRQSNIRQFLLELHNTNRFRRTWLIGDSGYPLEPILMVPFQHPVEDSPEFRFNERFIVARNCVERCIGRLKIIFRCLMKERTARYSPEFMGIVVNACAVLYNMRIEQNILEIPDNIPEHRDERERVEAYHIGNNLLEQGRRVRQNIVENYFN